MGPSVSICDDSQFRLLEERAEFSRHAPPFAPTTMERSLVCRSDPRMRGSDPGCPFRPRSRIATHTHVP